MVTPVRTADRSFRATGLDTDVRQLAQDDALLRGVQRRAASVRALAAAPTWPYAELDTLTGFLRAAVLPHATNEEGRLYPDGVAAPFAQLRAEPLKSMPSPNSSSTSTPPPAPWRNCGEWSTSLSITLLTEHSALDALLAALDDMPTMPDPDPDPGAPKQPLLILIDALREEHTVQMRVQRRHPGQPPEINASHDNGLKPLHQRDGGRDPVSARNRSARRRQAPAVAFDERRPDLVGRTRL
jgi:hypothetical protein